MLTLPGVRATSTFCTRSSHQSGVYWMYLNINDIVITFRQWAALHSFLFQCLQERFIRSLSSYHFHSSTSPFDHRITCLEWSPVHHTTLAVGSKGGDIHLWDYEVPTKKTFLQGVSSCKLVRIVSPDAWMINSVYLVGGQQIITFSL